MLQWGKAEVEAREPAAVGGGVRRVLAFESCGDRGGDVRELRDVVPEVRIGVGAVDAEYVGDGDHVARLRRRGLLEAGHERVVAHPVLDHELRLRHGKGVLRPRLEEVRVGIRVGEDRADVDVRAADLAGDVGVDALGCDDAQGAAGLASLPPPQPAVASAAAPPARRRELFLSSAETITVLVTVVEKRYHQGHERMGS